MGRWEIQVDKVSQQDILIKETGICQYPEESVTSRLQQDCRPSVRTDQQPRSQNKGKGAHFGLADNVIHHTPVDYHWQLCALCSVLSTIST